VREKGEIPLNRPRTDAKQWIGQWRPRPRQSSVGVLSWQRCKMGEREDAELEQSRYVVVAVPRKAKANHGTNRSSVRL
jgi:hypothetical protein